MRLIDADALLQSVMDDADANSNTYIWVPDMLELIRQAPTVQPEENEP